MIDKILQPLSVALDPGHSGSVIFMQTTTIPTIPVTKVVDQLSSFLPNILGAIASLLIGWILALIFAWVVGRILSKTSIDEKLLGTVTGGRRTVGGLSAEKLISTVVFWIVFLFGVVGFLNALNLTSASAPLQNMLSQISLFLPRLLIAGILVAVAWVVATLVKKLILTSSQSFGLDRKLQVADGGTMPSETIANLSFWLILFFFLGPILEALGLGNSLAPVQNLTNDLIGALPKLFKAGIIAAVTWFVAKIVRDIVTNLARAAGADRLSAQMGLNRSLCGNSGAWHRASTTSPGYASYFWPSGDHVRRNYDHAAPHSNGWCIDCDLLLYWPFPSGASDFHPGSIGFRQHHSSIGPEQCGQPSGS
jgi:hypothetical protein